MKNLLQYAPALGGHAFQQTAIISMVPLLAATIGLPESAMGLAISLGMLSAVFIVPFIASMGGRRIVIGGLTLLFGANIALLGLVGAANTNIATAVTLAFLLAIRFIQGTSIVAVMIAAQETGAKTAGTARQGLSKVQAMSGVGRIVSALMIGPLLLISPLAPLAPGAIGAGVSLLMSWRGDFPKLRPVSRPPPIAMLRLPILNQTALGAVQVGLAPLLVHRLGLTPIQAAGAASLCIAAANTGLLISAFLFAAQANRKMAKIAAVCMTLTAIATALTPYFGMILLCSALFGGSATLLLVFNLSELMTRKEFAQLQVTGWNAATQIAALALGVGIGSVLLVLSPSAPFAVAAVCGVAMALPIPPKQRT